MNKGSEKSKQTKNQNKKPRMYKYTDIMRLDMNRNWLRN